MKKEKIYYKNKSTKLLNFSKQPMSLELSIFAYHYSLGLLLLNLLKSDLHNLVDKAIIVQIYKVLLFL